MDKETFRQRLVELVDARLEDEELDDDMTFSELWAEVRDGIDAVADNEDIEELSGDLSAEL